MKKTCSLLSVPVETGASRRGCLMGPDSLKTAGLEKVIRSFGCQVTDLGQVTIAAQPQCLHANRAIHHLAETKAWIESIEPRAYQAACDFDLPIFLGGDHSMAAGTVSGLARYAHDEGRPLYILWLDAHPDIHTLESSESGNLHGTPVAYFTGEERSPDLPELAHTVPLENILMMGIRSVDSAERERISALGIDVQDMRSIDETGVLAPLRSFLNKVRAQNGLLHLSFDVDFLDPSIAPGVGTTVPGGINYREAHLIMETLCDSGLLTSLEIAELNPFLDRAGMTAELMCELIASLFGRRIVDRHYHRDVA